MKNRDLRDSRLGRLKDAIPVFFKNVGKIVRDPAMMPVLISTVLFVKLDGRDVIRSWGREKHSRKDCNVGPLIRRVKKMFMLNRGDESHKAGYARTIIVSTPSSEDGATTRLTEDRFRKGSLPQSYDVVRSADSEPI